MTNMVLIDNRPDESVEWIFMEVSATHHGEPANEKFFLGRLPEEGEAVEMVYVGSKEGRMRFQLRVRASTE
jgi:hypothetical protein